MTKRIYAVKFDCAGKKISTVEIGKARMTDNYISANKYNQLKRELFKTFSNTKKAYIRMITEDGLVATFGGYPKIGGGVFFK